MPLPAVADESARAAAPSAQRGPRSTWALVLLASVAATLFAGFLALGVWQVERRAWKLGLIESVAERLHAAPVPAPPASQWAGFDATQHLYLPVHLEGRWLPSKVALVQATTAFGAGYWVVMALQQADGTQVLVNRGFVPQAQRNRWLNPLAPSDANAANATKVINTTNATSAEDGGAPVALVGLLRASEPGGGFLRHNDPAAQRWYSRDVTAIALALALPHAAPFFVDAGLPNTSGRQALEEMQPAVGPWPRPGLTAVRFANNHLVYALTWFGLALMVAWAVRVVARYEGSLRKSRHRATSPDESHAPPPR